jgi:signal-transduction protein with cAMP-binding, CBS, and nucleotidyltransferase domain
VGLLTDRDVARAAAREEGRLVDLEVRDAMGAVPACSSPGASALEALCLMGRHSMTRLPVTDPGGRLVGVVSMGDIASAVSHSKSEEAKATRREICDGLAKRARVAGREGDR